MIRVARKELERAMTRMRAPGFPRPYFISYMVRDEERWRIRGKYGSLKSATRDRSRNAFADVRVGSYRSDHVRDGGLVDNDKDAESYGYVDLPYSNDGDGLTHGLWLLTDARYREAVEAWLEKKSRSLTFIDSGQRLNAFERREPSVDRGWSPFPEVDVDLWSGYVKRVSALIKRYADIKDSYVEFEADHVCRNFVSSEGACRVQCHAIWSLDCYLWLLSEKGDAHPWTLKYIVADPSELPTESKLKAEIRKAVARVREISRATPVRSFCGPVLLEPGPAGLLMHEAVGHRLEGSRLMSSGEGQTFRDSIGELVLPEFLSLRDDPRMRTFEGRSLVGHYRFDDEGVDAQDARLIVDGKLERFMGTRVGHRRGHHSSGHARSCYHERPISRMGVTVVEARDGLSDRQIKKALVDEIRRQDAPFGVRVIEASSGETATDSYNFQAFLGEINLAAKVYPDGTEEWIRGVNFIGTPLNAIRSIIAAGKRLHVDNAFCGAESGYVPVSTICPALVVSELELQSKPDTPYTPYTLPIPWRRT